MKKNKIQRRHEKLFKKVRWGIWETASFLLFGSQLAWGLLWHFIPKNCNRFGNVKTMTPTWTWTLQHQVDNLETHLKQSAVTDRKKKKINLNLICSIMSALELEKTDSQAAWLYWFQLSRANVSTWCVCWVVRCSCTTRWVRKMCTCLRAGWSAEVPSGLTFPWLYSIHS